MVCSVSVPRRKSVDNVSSLGHYVKFVIISRYSSLKYRHLILDCQTVLECLTLKDGTDRLSLNVGYYQCTLPNIPEG